MSGMPERTPPPPETGRRFRRAAVFLLHYRSDDPVSAQGVLEILSEVDAGEDGDWRETAGFMCAVADLAWKMARAPDAQAAEDFVRSVAATAALDEAMGGGTDA